MVLDAIRQSIPLQWDALICPRCQKPDHLKAELQELDLSGSIYRFGVVLTCTACKKVQTFAKLLKGLWSIARIKISLTGIEIEKSAKSA
jgi:RNase P subunit RPR2